MSGLLLDRTRIFTRAPARSRAALQRGRIVEAIPVHSNMDRSAAVGGDRIGRRCGARTVVTPDKRDGEDDGRRDSCKHAADCDAPSRVPGCADASRRGPLAGAGQDGPAATGLLPSSHRAQGRERGQPRVGGCQSWSFSCPGTGGCGPAWPAAVPAVGVRGVGAPCMRWCCTRAQPQRQRCPSAPMRRGELPRGHAR